MIVTSVDDPRLNEVERDLWLRQGHNSQLTIPLRIREQIANDMQTDKDKKSDIEKLLIKCGKKA